MYLAYFDRKTEDGKAVLLIEQLQQEFIVPIGTLPSNSSPGTWFDVLIKEGAVVHAEVNKQKTKQMEDKIQDTIHRLRRRKGSRYET